ncbi:MAG: DEAD/DEAH box helicase [Candidatus Kapaibacterium sp.]|nr:MAG: DEAD/DEAH box helicase [Candidatus Kapabacteria bacterium]
MAKKTAETSPFSGFARLGEFVALDFETTGLNPKEDMIIEVGAVRYRAGQEVERFSTLVNPERKLSLEIAQLTGIQPEELKSAPNLTSMANKLYAFLGDSPIMAHNADFERKFLQSLFGEDYLPKMMDSCHLLAYVYPFAPTLSLEYFIRQFGIRDHEHHRGLQDALDMVEVVRHVDEALNEASFAEPSAIIEHYFEKTEVWGWKPLFVGRFPDNQHFYNGDLPALRNFRSQFAEQERPALEARLSTAPMRLSEAEFFKSEYKQYQLRDSQQKLAQKAAQILNDGGIYVAEAGTGTGKTLAYLTATLASLSTTNESPVVVSTHTKALQNQFLEQELPRLQRLFATPELKAVVLKGMNNYACLRKIREIMPLFDGYMYADNEKELYSAAFLTRWMLATNEGEIEELPRPLHEFPVIQAVARDARADYRDCNRQECSFFEQCLFFRKQWEAASAHILAVNHSLLLTYPKSYPEFDRLVVDEADEIVQESIEAFSDVAAHSTMFDFHRFMSGEDGVLKRVADEVRLVARSASQSPQTAASKRSSLDDLAVSDMQLMLERFSQSLARLGMVMSMIRGEEFFVIQATLEDQRISATSRQQIIAEAENLRIISTDMLNAAEKFLKAALRLISSAEEVPTVKELQSRLKDAEKFHQTLKLFLEQDTDKAALYMRIDRNDWAFVATPYNIGERFAEAILKPRFAAVFTSATISNTRDMSDFLRGIGTHTLEHQTSTSRFKSPFDYKRNSKIVFLKNFVPNNHFDFARLSAEFILNAAETLGGRTLVLFTSKERQRKVHELLFPMLREQGMELISHGITQNSQHKCVEQFKFSKKAVLMGARGLWKGVDIPGDDLQCLVLEKMPYAVPNPFTKGLQELLVKQYQGDALERGETPDLKRCSQMAWNDVDKPLMFQAFRQMFGRLIRTETDKGVMFVLDSQLQGSTLSPRHKQLLELLPDVAYGLATPEQALRELNFLR